MIYMPVRTLGARSRRLVHSVINLGSFRGALPLSTAGPRGKRAEFI
jgi:hypothetical protein